MSDKIIDDILASLELDKKDDEGDIKKIKASLKKDMQEKASNIIAYNKANNIPTTEDHLKTRLSNYAKGKIFNNKIQNSLNVGSQAYMRLKEEQKEETDSPEKHNKIINSLLDLGAETIVDYQAPVGADDEKLGSLLTEHYSDLADSYAEYLDTDCNEEVTLREAFLIECSRYYIQQQDMTVDEAKKKALEDFNKLNISSLEEKITDKSEITDPIEQIYEALYTKFKLFNIDSNEIKILSKQEIQRYLALASQYDSKKQAAMTDMEIFALETDIAAANEGHIIESLDRLDETFNFKS